MVRLSAALFVLWALSGCTQDVSGPTTTVVDQPSTTAPAAPGPTVPDLSELEFDEFVDQSYRLLLIREPEHLTSLGISAEFGMRNDTLNDYSPEFIAETEALELLRHALTEVAAPEEQFLRLGLR